MERYVKDLRANKFVDTSKAFCGHSAIGKYNNTPSFLLVSLLKVLTVFPGGHFK